MPVYRVNETILESSYTTISGTKIYVEGMGMMSTLTLTSVLSPPHIEAVPDGDATRAVLFAPGTMPPINTDDTPTISLTDSLVKTDNMTIMLGTCSSDRRTVTKTWTPVIILGGTLLEGASVVSPAITIQTDEDMLPINYAHVSVWGRYYYVAVTILYKGVWRLDMSVDALRSFDTSIRACSGLVERQENDYNAALADNQVAPTLDRTIERFTTAGSGTSAPSVIAQWSPVTDNGSLRTSVPPSRVFKTSVDPGVGNDDRCFLLIVYDTSAKTFETNPGAGGMPFYRSASVAPFLRAYAIRRQTLTYSGVTVGGVDEVAAQMNSYSFVSTVKKLFNDPAQYLVGLRLYPFDLTPYGSSYNTVTGLLEEDDIWIGSYQVTGVKGPLVDLPARIYVGSVYVPPNPSYLDRAPFASYSVYIPYYGYLDIPDEIMFSGHPDNTGTSETYPGMYGFDVYMMIDFTTGDTLIELVNAETPGGSSRIISTYKGSMGIDVPIASSNYAGMLRGGTTTLVSAISAVAGLASGNPAAALGGAAGVLGGLQSMKTHFNHGQIAGGGASLVSSPTLALQITRSGRTSTTGMAAVVGRPLHEVRALSTLSGMTTVSNVILDGIACTDQERELIRSALAGGVIL